MAEIKPVLIVGGGPTGMMLAAELMRRDVPCRIIDRKEGPTLSSRAFTIHARTLEIFEAMGIADRYLSTGIKSYGFLFNFEGLEKKPVLDFRILRSRYPYILVYSQAEQGGTRFIALGARRELLVVRVGDGGQDANDHDDDHEFDQRDTAHMLVHEVAP